MATTVPPQQPRHWRGVSSVGTRTGRGRSALIASAGAVVGAAAAGVGIPAAIRSLKPHETQRVISRPSAVVPPACAPAFRELGDVAGLPAQSRNMLWASTASTCGLRPDLMFTRRKIAASAPPPASYGFHVARDRIIAIGTISLDGGSFETLGINLPRIARGPDSDQLELDLVSAFRIDRIIAGDQQMAEASSFNLPLRNRVTAQLDPSDPTKGVINERADVPILTGVSGPFVAAFERVDDRFWQVVGWSVAPVVGATNATDGKVFPLPGTKYPDLPSRGVEMQRFVENIQRAAQLPGGGGLATPSLEGVAIAP